MAQHLHSLLKKYGTVHQQMSSFIIVKRLAATTTAIQDPGTASIKTLKEIPGYRSFPFIGTSWVFLPIVGKFSKSEVHLYDAAKYHRFGDICCDKFANQVIVNVFNEKDIETILRAESKHPIRGFLTALKKYREMRKEWFKTTGVLLTNGKEWYDLRFRLQRHLMKPRTIDRYIGPTIDVARDCIRRISSIKNKNNEVDDLMDDLFRWSLESVAVVAMEKRLGCLEIDSAPDSEGHKMIKAVQDSFDCMNHLEAISGRGFQFWKHFPTPTWNRFVKAMDCFSETAYRNVQDSMNALKTKCPEHEELTLLQAMLNSGDIEPHEAMVMAIDMLMGGVDTTSNTMGFLLYHLATNPDKQEKLHRDITRVLTSPSDELTPNILAEMRYLKLCLKESLRLHPIARIIVRTLPCDVVLSGYHVPAGTMILGMLQTCGRLERYYKNANQFIPERWEDKDNKPSPFLNLPFGFGTRSCIGRRIAEIELWTLATEIIRNFKVEFRQQSFGMENRMANVVQRPVRFAFIDRK